MGNANRGFQTIYGADGETVISEGWWDPKGIIEILDKAHGSDPYEFWVGKKVIDIGSNSCGLAVEIARRGAHVVAVEPNEKAINMFESVRPVLASESLNIELRQNTLEDVLGWDESFDVVLFLGLLYHFKYPQFIINSLATIPHEWLFISTQCTSREGLVQVNRLEEMPERLRVTMTELTGWHLSRELFSRMLTDAGWSNIQEGSDPSWNFFNTPRAITNSTYYCAERTGGAQERRLKNMQELYRFYPR